jgi:hypothetical protein
VVVVFVVGGKRRSSLASVDTYGRSLQRRQEDETFFFKLGRLHDYRLFTGVQQRRPIHFFFFFYIILSFTLVALRWWRRVHEVHAFKR